MMWTLLVCASLLVVGWSSTASAQRDPQNMVTYDEKFITGVRNYAEAKWADAIIYISQAMEEFKQLEQARLRCFRDCNKAGSAITLQSNSEQLQFFLKVIEKDSCIKTCEERVLEMVPWGGIPHHVLRQLKNKDGYNYLQLSMFREEKFKEAARAMTTFQYFTPHDITVKKSMSFYESMPQLSEEDLVSLETLAYRDLFAEGHRLFYTNDSQKMVETFEASLALFYIALDDCRTMCDGPLEYDAFLDFSQVVSKIYLDRLNCRVNCVQKLGEFREDRTEDFFGIYFHYLQRGYFHMNKSLEALQSSAAQARLEPNNESARRNSEFYLRQPGVTRKNLKPREDVTPEVLKREADLSMLKLYDDFADHTYQEGAESQMEGDLDEVLLEEDFQHYPVATSLHLVMENIEPVVVQSAADFGGVERMVVDEMLTERHCQALIRLASYGKEGDGYQTKSPHTTKEKFEGLHILDTAERAVSGEIEENLSWLYLNSSAVSKEVVARHFSLKTPLYFSYTHLVCRTALEGAQEDRSDLSHPVHSDNCIYNDATKDCDKVPPAYTWRDYSAILYLNDDFEGGDFFFAHSVRDFSPDVRVKPRCGRLVGFSAGKENMHGVTAVTKGKRCAIALWFTLDPLHRESTFDLAADLLYNKLETKSP